MNSEEVRPATTPEEMRAELNRLSLHIPMIRSVEDLAYFKGLSGEDKYTVLAYHAISLCEKMKQHVLEQAQLSPRAILMKE